MFYLILKWLKNVSFSSLSSSWLKVLFFTLEKDVENIHTSGETSLKLIRILYKTWNFHRETFRAVWNDYMKELLSSFQSEQQASFTTSEIVIKFCTLMATMKIWLR